LIINLPQHCVIVKDNACSLLQEQLHYQPTSSTRKLDMQKYLGAYGIPCINIKALGGHGNSCCLLTTTSCTKKLNRAD